MISINVQPEPLPVEKKTEIIARYAKTMKIPIEIHPTSEDLTSFLGLPKPSTDVEEALNDLILCLEKQRKNKEKNDHEKRKDKSDRKHADSNG